MSEEIYYRIERRNSPAEPFVQIGDRFNLADCIAEMRRVPIGDGDIRILDERGHVIVSTVIRAEATV